MRLKKIADIEALKQAKLIKDQVLNKQDDSLPSPILSNKGADIFIVTCKLSLLDMELMDLSL